MPTPAAVVDLGCGTGNLTVLLARRWPQAQVLGVDSSAEMIAAAPVGEGVRVHRRRHRRLERPMRRWTCSSPTPRSSGSPATSTCCPRLVDAVAPGGWLAFQVPGNFDEPSHTIRRELAAEAPYAEHTAGVAAPDAHDAATYLHVLRDLGCEVDAWETTYLHVLHGEDPVFTWVSGTGARPTLQALPDDLRPRVRGGVQAPPARGLPVPRRRGRAAVPPGVRGRPAVNRRFGRLVRSTSPGPPVP